MRFQKLPYWVLENPLPALYDGESLTTVQMTAKVYSAMQRLVEDYNKYVDEVNKHIENQDMDIEDAIQYMKDNLINSIKKINDDGNLDLMILAAISGAEKKLMEAQKDYETEMKNNQTDYEEKMNDKQSDFQNEINSQVRSLASGTPLVASSTAGMTDTSKVYVNTTDGNWYYHNGSSWVVGGVYQATEAGEETINVNHIDKGLKESTSIRIPTYETVSGFRNEWGSINENSSFVYSKPIKLNKGETIFLKAGGYLQNVSMITLVTEEGKTISSNVKSIDSDIHLYKFSAKDECYVSICYSVNKFSYVNISQIVNDNVEITKNETLNQIKGIDLKLENAITAKYINNSGNEYEYSNDYYSASDYIEIPSNTEMILKNINWNSEDEACYAFYDKDKNLIKATKLTACVDLEFKTPSNSKYFRFTINNLNRTKYGLYLFVKTDLIQILEKLESKSLELTKNLFAGFVKFGVIGDSLASGECCYLENGQQKYIDLYNISWGQFMARKYGMECINFSSGGLSTRTWLTAPRGLSKLQEESNKCKAYVIGLGVNDYYHLGEDYLGTITDINMGNILLSSDTFYGNYAKIIYHVKQVEPKAKIFMLTIPNTSNNELKDKFNVAIRQISNLFENVYLIDLDSDYNDEYSGFINDNQRAGHFNAITYQYMGDLLFNIFSDYMYKNYTEFNQIEFIGTDYSY